MTSKTASDDVLDRLLEIEDDVHTIADCALLAHRLACGRNSLDERDVNALLRMTGELLAASQRVQTSYQAICAVARGE